MKSLFRLNLFASLGLLVASATSSIWLGDHLFYNSQKAELWLLFPNFLGLLVISNLVKQDVKVKVVALLATLHGLITLVTHFSHHHEHFNFYTYLLNALELIALVVAVRVNVRNYEKGSFKDALVTRIIALTVIAINVAIQQLIAKDFHTAGFISLFAAHATAALAAVMLTLGLSHNSKVRLFDGIGSIFSYGLMGLHFLLFIWRPDGFVQPALPAALAMLSAGIVLPQTAGLLITPLFALVSLVGFANFPFDNGPQISGISAVILMTLFISVYSVLVRQKLEMVSKEAKANLERINLLSRNSEIVMFEQNLSSHEFWKSEEFDALIPSRDSNNFSSPLEKLFDRLDNQTTTEVKTLIAKLEANRTNITKNISLTDLTTEKTHLIEARFSKSLVEGDEVLSVALINKTSELHARHDLETAQNAIVKSKYKISSLEELLGLTAAQSASDILNIDLKRKTARLVYGGQAIHFPYQEFKLEQLLNVVLPSYRGILNSLLDGSTQTNEIPIEGSHKEVCWWRIAPIKQQTLDKDTSVLNFYVRDITQEKYYQERILQARQEAEVAVRKLNVTADTAHIGLLDIDPVTERIRPSATLREMLNLPHTEYLPIKALQRIFSEVGAERLISVLDDLAFFTGPERFDLVVEEQEGVRHFVMYLSSQGLLSADRKVLGSVMETTEYLVLQDKLSEALSSAEQSLAELQQRYETEHKLFGVIAHEIRTPVSAIRMMLEDDKEHQNELLKTTQELESIIDGLTDLVKKQSDQIETKVIENSSPVDGVPFVLEGSRVLLAEDTPTIRMLSTKLIESQGAVVEAAEDGQKALEIALNSSFDLVITDIFMPNMDGYELTRSLRESGYKGPIIGVTAATIGEERDKLLAAGANAAIGKPLTKEKLLDTLASLYDYTEHKDS